MRMGNNSNNTVNIVLIVYQMFTRHFALSIWELEGLSFFIVHTHSIELLSGRERLMDFRCIFCTQVVYPSPPPCRSLLHLVQQVSGVRATRAIPKLIQINLHC